MKHAGWCANDLNAKGQLHPLVEEPRGVGLGPFGRPAAPLGFRGGLPPDVGDDVVLANVFHEGRIADLDGGGALTTLRLALFYVGRPLYRTATRDTTDVQTLPSSLPARLRFLFDSAKIRLWQRELVAARSGRTHCPRLCRQDSTRLRSVYGKWPRRATAPTALVHAGRVDEREREAGVEP